MKVQQIIWLPDKEEKLWRKHEVLLHEVEEVLFGRPHIRFVEKGYTEGEDMYATYGRTEEGRYLIIFFILKHNGGNKALIASARDMGDKERKLYGKRK